MGWPSCQTALGRIVQVVVMVPSEFTIQVPLSREGSSTPRRGSALPSWSSTARALFVTQLVSPASALPSNLVARFSTSPATATVTFDGVRGAAAGALGCAALL